ncbi:MAG: endo-1,3-alpha-glucanase family glycosylhydrolase [bacterium]
MNKLDQTRIISSRSYWILTLFCLVWSVCLQAADTTPLRPKKVFAHYMGCWPVASGALAYEKREISKNLKHTSTDKATKLGGHVRNYDLVPPGMELTAEESADLEIKRAMRIGIDGFAVDAWAGGNDAKRSLDAMFKVAEEKDYPFELTVCLDPSCGGDPVGTVKELLEKHGKSPKFARRDGKPLIFGYLSCCYGMGPLIDKTDDKLSKEERKKAAEKLFVTPEGWNIMGQYFKDAAEKVGQPVAYHYCMTYFFFQVDKSLVKKGMLTEAAGVLSKYVQAIGGFTYLGGEQDAIAKIVKENGAEWSQPVGHYQKENIPYECYTPPGTEWMGCWDGAIKSDATLLQLITWNDYGENTNIAPALNTRYDLYDLTGYYISWWKTGKAPEPDHDKIYLNYHKYPKNSPIYPFKSTFGPRDYVLEVITILPKPAKIKLPGRDIEYDAPAGFTRKQFPLVKGAVIAELLRDGKVETRLESPEPITDKPFREDNSLVCFSTEDARHWKADFKDLEPFWYSEYGDADKDGLPNWFEMYWSNSWFNFKAMTKMNPDDDPDEDEKTNLEEYKAQTDPTTAPPKEDPE